MCKDYNMSQRESKLSRKIMNHLRLEGYFCFKVHGNEHTMSGLPDIIVCVDGLFVGLETKNPGEAGDTSVAQDRVHEKIRKAHGFVSVVTSIAEAVVAVEQAREEFDRRQRPS